MLENHISLMHGIKNPDLSQMAKAKVPERDTAEVTDIFSLQNNRTWQVAVPWGCHVEPWQILPLLSAPSMLLLSGSVRARTKSAAEAAAVPGQRLLHFSRHS